MLWLHVLLFFLLRCYLFSQQEDAYPTHPHVLKIAPEALASTSFATLRFKHSAMRSYQTRHRRGGAEAVSENKGRY